MCIIFSIAIPNENSLQRGGYFTPEMCMNKNIMYIISSLFHFISLVLSPSEFPCYPFAVYYIARRQNLANAQFMTL